ncbi:hypothetical protein [Aquabacterium sp.]|uniref:hypothetical protein n=1 Tax=Aquabacterium sp. TaxID=1872578 RepID=UPI003784C92D
MRKPIAIRRQHAIAAHPVFQALNREPAAPAELASIQAGELLALDDLARGVATERATQDLIDMLLTAGALGRMGIGPEVLPLLGGALGLALRLHAGPKPARLEGPGLALLRQVRDLHDQQRRIASRAELVRAGLEAMGQLAAATRRAAGSSTSTTR